MRTLSPGNLYSRLQFSSSEATWIVELARFSRCWWEKQVQRAYVTCPRWLCSSLLVRILGRALWGDIARTSLGGWWVTWDSSVLPGLPRPFWGALGLWLLSWMIFQGRLLYLTYHPAMVQLREKLVPGKQKWQGILIAIGHPSVSSNYCQMGNNHLGLNELAQL